MVFSGDAERLFTEVHGGADKTGTSTHRRGGGDMEVEPSAVVGRYRRGKGGSSLHIGLDIGVLSAILYVDFAAAAAARWGRGIYCCFLEVKLQVLGFSFNDGDKLFVLLGAADHDSVARRSPIYRD